MTAEERTAFAKKGHAASLAAHKARSPLERRFIGIKAARTKREQAAWMRKQATTQALATDDRRIRIDAESPVDELRRLIDAADDEAIRTLAGTITRGE